MPTASVYLPCASVVAVETTARGLGDDLGLSPGARAMLDDLHQAQTRLSALVIGGAGGRDAEKSQAERSALLARIEQLKDDLKKAGVDITTLNDSLTEQARALDDFKKRAEQLDQIRKKFELLKQKLEALTKLGLKCMVSSRNRRRISSYRRFWSMRR